MLELKELERVSVTCERYVVYEVLMPPLTILELRFPEGTIVFFTSKNE